MRQLDASLLALPEQQRAALAIQLLKTTSSATLLSVSRHLYALTTRDFIGTLPTELAVYILSLTNVFTLYRISQVCQKYRLIALDNSIWRRLYFNQGWKVDTEYLLSTLGNLSSVSLLASAYPISQPMDAVSITQNDARDGGYGTLPRALLMDSFQPHESFSSDIPAFSDPMLESQTDTSFLPLETVKDTRPSITHLDQSRLLPHDPQIDWKSIYKQRLKIQKNWENQDYAVSEFQGHQEAIYCLQFDTDKILTGSRDGGFFSLNINS